jgi:ERCC4-related helicase
MAFINHELINENLVEARLYQEVLVSRIIEKGNTLVVAPTALGKTIIAVLLTAYKLKENNNSKILFLAPTKPLALQHEKSLKKFLKIDDDKITTLTGTTAPKKRAEIYKKKQIISATPQTIENDLLTGNMNLKKFDLIIFDEAHRAIGDYAYVFINLQLQKQNKKALIVALTASPGSEEEKIQDVCKNLSIKNIEIKNNEDDDVKPYINEIEIDWVKVELPKEFSKIKLFLEEFQKKQLIFLKKLHIAITENKKYYNRLRILEMQQKIRRIITSGNAEMIHYMAASKCAALLKVAHAEELIETQGIGSLNNYFSKIIDENNKGKSKASKLIINDEGIRNAMLLTKKLFEKKIQHPKYKELKKIILEQLEKKPESKIIVFNHYRDSIKEVVSFLESNEKIKVSNFIGQAKKGNEKGMNQKKQEEILNELRNGKFNVLVSSSVAEEGLDIPSVELVIFFEPVPSEIRTIQRRGRTGRFGKGKTIILMAKGTRDEAFYWAAKGKEKKMKKILNEMKKNGNEILKDDLRKERVIPEQSTLTNYFEKKDGIIIFVDNREQVSNVTKKLFEKECKVIMKQLTIGDYILSKDVCVERKTIDDFLSSMIDGRLFNQLVDLRTNYEKPLLILEGNINEIFNLRNIHKNAIIGALTSIALDYQVPIINTKNADETAEYVFLIAKREQIAKEKEIRLRMGKKGFSIKEQQQFITEGFPLVGPSLAKNLLKEFKSIKNIVNANEKDLQKIENLGKKKALQLKKIFEAEYESEKKQ